MIKYKDPMFEKLYRGLLGHTPKQVSDDMKIWGSMLSAFTFGYEGSLKPHYISRNTGDYVAYMAGRDTKIKKKEYINGMGWTKTN